MQQIILLYIFFVFTTTYSQVDLFNPNLITNNVDSIHFSIWEIHTKEMSTPGQENGEYENKLDQITLSKKDQNSLILNLSDPKSYDQSRALLHHYNLVFRLYHEGLISNEIYISTMTGNIDIDNKFMGSNFRTNCSEQFGKVLMDLLIKYDFFKLIDEFDLEGISSYGKK